MFRKERKIIVEGKSIIAIKLKAAPKILGAAFEFNRQKVCYRIIIY